MSLRTQWHDFRIHCKSVSERKLRLREDGGPERGLSDIYFSSVTIVLFKDIFELLGEVWSKINENR